MTPPTSESSFPPVGVYHWVGMGSTGGAQHTS